MAKMIDLIGKKFNRLTVIEKAGQNKHKKTLFKCMCECGSESIVVGSGLLNGNTKSCGCLQKERAIAAIKKACTKHGLTRHPLYGVWIDINRRCYDSRDTTYHNYGARGIQVCDEWRHDFKSFYDWCMCNGWELGLEVDRYPDNNGHYLPGNCRITTSKNNCNNKRTNVYAEIDGVVKTAAEWSDLTGINRSCIAKRIKMGVTGKDAVYGIGSGNKFSGK